MGQFLVVLSGLVIPVMIVAIVSAGLLAKKMCTVISWMERRMA